jgi:hypothetical protein
MIAIGFGIIAAYFGGAMLGVGVGLVLFAVSKPPVPSALADVADEQTRIVC